MTERSTDPGFTLRWFTQAGLGLLLIVLLAVHLIVNHWLAPQGLLTYTDVIRYYDFFGVVWMEAIFLIVVTVHCLLGIHAIVLDLNVSPTITRVLTRAIGLAGVITLLYGLWLITRVHSLSVS